MFSLSFYKCLLKCSIIIILLECTAQTQAVENWYGEDHYNSGRKLMGSSMNGGEFVVYIIVVTVISLISICCRFYCRQACKDECSSEESSDDCDACCGCDDHSLTHPSHPSGTVTHAWQQPVQQQPRPISSYANFGDLSTEPGTPSFYNRTNFATPQNTATIFAQDNSSTQAPQLYNFSNNPSVPQLYTVPSESHVYSIPTIPAPVNSVNTEDPPPDYASVVLGDIVRGIEQTPYPRVIQDK